MSTELATTTNEIADIAERVAIAGDLSKLQPAERMAYYGQVCRSLGLNPLTRPFQYITLNGKLTLYATRDATDQLRRQQRISIQIIGRERIDDVYVVTAKATTPDGRTDESTGVVALGTAKGEMLANALMKAETKAKRRVTMSICGLGWMDESELDTLRSQAISPRVDYETGEVLDSVPAANGIAPKTMRLNAPPVDERAEALGEMRRAFAAARRVNPDLPTPDKAAVNAMSVDEIRDWIGVYNEMLAPADEVNAENF